MVKQTESKKSPCLLIPSFIPLLQISIVILENIVEDRQSLMPEIEKIKAALPQTLSEDEKLQMIDKILEEKYPNTVENRKRYRRRPIHDGIIKTIETFSI